MNTRPTIIVLIVAVVAVAVDVIVHRADSGARTAPGEASRLLESMDFPVDAIDRLTLRRGDAAPMVFEHHDDAWMQVAPFPHPMDSFSMRQFAVLARDLEVVDRIDPERLAGSLSPSSLSLDPPAAILEYQWPDGALTIRLGRRGMAGRAYLRLGDDPTVLVVNRDLHDRAIDMSPTEWRERRLFRYASVESDRIDRQQGDLRVILERDRTQWLLREPVHAGVDAAARDEYFQILGEARSDGFILDQPDDLAAFGLAQPAAILAIQSHLPPGRAGADGSAPVTERLLVGARVGIGSQDRFAMIDGRPVIIRLKSALLLGLFKPPAQLVDATGSRIWAADVKSVRINGPGGRLRFDRDLERWRAPDAGGIEVPAAYVEELLRQLTATRAPEVEIRPYPRELEVATVTLHGFDQRPLDTVRIIRDPESGTWALENGDDVLRKFPGGMTLRLTPQDYGLPAPTP